ncbi:MAG: galactose oxidase-like domain-containing protein [Gemmatimonadales bacterium]
MALGVAILACQDGTTPGPEIDPELMGGSAVCSKTFALTNGNPGAATVGFEVTTSGETGELSLPARPEDGQESVTTLATVTSGSLRVTFEGALVEEIGASGAACPPPSPAPQPQASIGRWAAPFAWPVIAVHLHLLPSGRVLSWGKGGEPQVWDPVTGAFAEVPSATRIFCAGHAFLPDGRLMVAGGHISNDHGLPDANLFDPQTEDWVTVAPMARGRWYPTVTTMPSGRPVVLAGRDQNQIDVLEPEVWTGSSWRTLTAAPRSLPYYPRAFVAPNGLLFYAGELRQSAYLDPSGDGSWIDVASSLYGQRDYGSAMMYRPGRVLIVGGSNPPNGAPTATAEVIDLNAGGPAWHYTGSMANARRHLNATLLPDGRVLATGGTSSAGFSDPTGAVHAAEVWNPATGDWSTWASNAVTRVYHGTSLLLPDGRILNSGSGDGAGVTDERNAELFSPPYLFRGARPVIVRAPLSIRYGQSFSVATPDAGRVVRASLVRLGSVTHAFDQNQHFLELELRRSAGGVTLTVPEGATLAPPGHYMLFLLNSYGVPSVARIVRLS